MSQFIQSLEQRMLMSATSDNLTTDLKTVLADGLATRVALVARRATAVEFGDAVRDDLRILDTRTNRLANDRLLATLVVTGERNYLHIVAAENVLLLTANALSIVATAGGKALLKHPTNVVLQRVVNNAITALNTKIPLKLAALETQVTNAVTAVNGVYSEIAAANPSIASVIQTGEADVAVKTSAFINAATQVSVATGNLATDLGTIAPA